MQFVTCFGLGEIVLTKQRIRHDGVIHRDESLQIVGIVISDGAEEPYYLCRHTNGMSQHYKESELLGDENYNQETCSYPDEQPRALKGEWIN